MCCCGANCGCSCASCACGAGGGGRTVFGTMEGYPTSNSWTEDQVTQYQRKHYADQCCKHDDNTPHTPKAVRNEGGLWQRFVSELDKL